MKPALLNILAIALAPLLSGCTDLGESVDFGAGNIYYKDGVTKEEAQRLGALLEKMHMKSEEEARDLQVLKVGETYVVKVPAEADLDFTEDVVEFFGGLKTRIAMDIFPGKTVKLQVTDENLELIREF